INDHPKSNIFQTSELYFIYESSIKVKPIWVIVLDANQNILGTLLAIIHKEHSGILGKFSSRAIIWGGPLIKDDNEQVLDYLLSNFNKIIRKKVIYSQFRNIWNWNESEIEIFAKHGYIF